MGRANRHRHRLRRAGVGTRSSYQFYPLDGHVAIGCPRVELADICALATAGFLTTR